MSGNTAVAPVEWRQRNVDQMEAQQTHMDGRQSQIHTSMPGTIVSFDPKTMTAVVQPAIQGLHTQLDGTKKPLDISTIPDVPVHFPAGGGYTMTFPIKKGDECLIVFNERNIDNWHQHGGQQTPACLRMHDINDAVVHVGLRSQPNVIPNVNPDNVHMRSDDGTRYIEINNNSDTITLVAGNIVLQAKNVTINATSQMTIKSPSVDVNS